MSKMKKVLCMLMCASLLLTAGCISTQPVEKQTGDLSLPEVRSGPEAPVGDSQMAQEYHAVLYVPSDDGTRLNTVVQRVIVQPGQTKHEAFVSALLSAVDQSGFNSTRQTLRLSTVSNAVETTRDLVTVNLSASMLFLSLEAQFALRVAIVNTLTELSGTNYVSILVDGRDSGLDVGETMPSGVMSRFPGSDISTFWSQVQSQRGATAGELQKDVALYFVAEDGESLLGEVRTVTFQQSTPALMARTILEEMNKGATRIAGARLLVPSQEWFVRDPQYDAENKTIVLYFHEAIEDYLTLRNGTMEMMLSSICYTLTSFVPGLEGIVVYVGGELLTSLGTQWSMQSGVMTRESVSALAADVCTLYYPLADGAALYAQSRPIAQRLRTQPRALLRELMKAPRNTALTSVFPGGITEADIIGLQILGDTALLNVTAAFARACEGMDAEAERNMIYAIVNTLTEIEGVTRVRFFVEGNQTPLAGHMYIGGEFLRNSGLIYTGPLY